jgi:hypothetical protein
MHCPHLLIGVGLITLSTKLYSLYLLFVILRSLRLSAVRDSTRNCAWVESKFCCSGTLYRELQLFRGGLELQIWRRALSSLFPPRWQPEQVPWRTAITGTIKNGKIIGSCVGLRYGVNMTAEDCDIE